MSASARHPVRSSPATRAFIPSLKPGRRLLSHFTDAPRGDGIVRLPLRCPDWRAAHCLGALGNSSGPPRIGKRPGSILTRRRGHWC